MGTCERINCGYYWKEEWEDFPFCKFHGFGPAPCEIDDEYGEDEEDFSILLFFCANCLLTSQPQCGIIVVGQRAADEGQGPISRPDTPYGKFQILLATFHMRPVFP